MSPGELSFVIVVNLVVAAIRCPGWRWYRRLRGGRWARVTGFFWGRRWVRVGPECVEMVEEEWICLARGQVVVNAEQLVEAIAEVRGVR